MAERRVTVINARVQLVAVNMGRSAMILHNLGANQVFWSRDKLTAVGQGFPIPVGGFFAWLKSEGDDSWNAVYSFGVAGGSDIAISESFEKLPEEALLEFLKVRG